MKEKIKNLKFIDWVLILLVIFLPIAVLLFVYKGLDNDLWYLLTEGRYIIQNGIYRTDVLSLHTGLDIVVQNWLSAVILWIVFAFLKSKGIYFLVLFVNIVICFLLYKISMLISDNNKKVSIFVTLLTDINLCLYFIVSRPQIFSYTILLLLIFFLETYIKTNNKKILRFIPLLSFLEINLHAANWWFIVLFMIPYIIDGFKNKKLKLQGYELKPIIITLALSIAVAFINPYGYKAITFIFHSYGDKYMFKYIYELQPFTFSNIISVNVFAVALLSAMMYIYFREGQVRVRYLCLYCGTLILGMINVKSISLFFLVSMFPIALLLKDIVNKDKKYKKKAVKYILLSLLVLLTAASVILSTYRYVKIRKYIAFEHPAREAVDAIDIFTYKQPARVFVSFNDGGYLEYRGYKSYIDPRAEVFLKRNNHKEDIYKEFYEFESGMISIEDFIKKYNFDFIFLKLGDRLYNEEKIDNYFVIYDKIDTQYKVYCRNDIVSDEVRKAIIEEYEKAKKQRQKELEELNKKMNEVNKK